jgi:hypothetical protein
VARPDRRRLEGQVLNGVTLRDLVSQDLRQAIRVHDGRLRVLPEAEWKQHGAFFQLAGGRETVNEPAQLFAMVDAIVTALNGFLAGDELRDARQRLADARARFEETLSTPVSSWQAAYTPARLLALLEAEGLVRPAVRWF